MRKESGLFLAFHLVDLSSILGVVDKLAKGQVFL